jgi:hypothetical protein
MSTLLELISDAVRRAHAKRGTTQNDQDGDGLLVEAERAVRRVMAARMATSPPVLSGESKALSYFSDTMQTMIDRIRPRKPSARRRARTDLVRVEAHCGRRLQAQVGSLDERCRATALVAVVDWMAEMAKARTECAGESGALGNDSSSSNSNSSGDALGGDARAGLARRWAALAFAARGVLALMDAYCA